VLAYLCVDDDPARIATASEAMLAVQAAWLGVAPQDVYLIAGPAKAAAERVRQLWDAGAATVALRPLGDDPFGQVEKVKAALE
jgi:5,10-methylenetetrahydromethanopterin reductase